MEAQQYLILSNDDYQYTHGYYQSIADSQVNDNTYSYNSATKPKVIPATHNNANQQLQDLLQSDTVNYSQFSTQKKRLFPYDISFFSRDHTQDLTNQQGYNQLVGKMHFERSRNRQLVDELAKQKQRIIEKYLSEIMEEFKELSEENQRLRQVYKKQAGGGYKHQSQGKQLVRNNSGKQEEMKKSSQQGSQSQLSCNQTPRNSNNRALANRKSITTTGVIMSSNQQQQLVYNNGNNGRSGVTGYGNSISSSRMFYGVGGGNFYQPQKLDSLRGNQPGTGSSNKLINCDSGTSIIHQKNKKSKDNNTNNMIFAITQRSQHQHQPTLTQSESKIHNRRQSQFTQRKNYPTVISNNKENYNEDFLMMCDDQGEVSFYNNERMSQPGKMMKREKVSEVVGGGMGWNDQGKKKPSCGGNQSTVRRVLNQSTERASFKLSLNQQAYDNNNNPTNTKNIFIEFLETILLQEHLSSQTLTENIQQTTAQQERDIFIPTFHNIRYIQQLQKQITNKNIKLKQLQQVINVFKLEIEQIMGTDVRIVNQLMVDLLQVKGKYLEMQQKVDNIARLRVEVQGKEMAKQRILAKMKLQNQKQSHESKSQTTNDQKDNKCPNAFPIPQSIQTLFQLLSIPIAKNSKPIQYLNKIKQVPKNKDLFQTFDSKKRLSCNVKIKQVIDHIKEGRRKFNEVIKIYESRIVKLQQKIQRYKLQMSCSINLERKHGNIEK